MQFRRMSYSDLAARDLLGVEWDNMRHLSYMTGSHHLQLSSGETLIPKTRKQKFPQQNYKWETVNSADLPLTVLKVIHPSTVQENI